MKKLQNKKSGFTLIELLVVITIIGILATWATATYTSQIQRARDSTRITDVNALRWALEQMYQEHWRYPMANNNTPVTDSKDVAFWEISIYLETLPIDPKNTESCALWSPCDYLYSVWNDANGIKHQQFVVSTAFENMWNIKSRANSKTTDPNRLELGTWMVWTAPTDSSLWAAGETVTITSETCNTAISGVKPTWDNSPEDYMLIRWNCNP